MALKTVADPGELPGVQAATSYEDLSVGDRFRVEDGHWAGVGRVVGCFEEIAALEVEMEETQPLRDSESEAPAEFRLSFVGPVAWRLSAFHEGDQSWRYVTQRAAVTRVGDE